MSQWLVNSLDVISSSLNYSQWIYSLIKPYLKGVVLDVGSGVGAIGRQVDTPAVKKLILTDMDPKMIRQLKAQRFYVQDHEILELDIASQACVAQFAPYKIDVVTAVNVLEHIHDDLGALKNIFNILKPGGHVVIFVPAYNFIYGTLDEYAGHARRYRRSSLRPLMERAGFVVGDARYMNLFGTFTWYLAGKVLKHKHFSTKSCRRLDRVVPILRGLENVVQPPFGQSVLMVGCKPLP